VRIGLTLPSMLAGVDRATTLEWCRRIDDGPFSSLSMGERITYPNQELWAVLAAAAAVTERVRIISTVVLLPAHDAVMVAKQAATLDVLSGGRFTLGVGVGGREEDYRAIGASFARRHARMDEQVDVMRRIWAGERIDGCAPVGPQPVRPGGPPILVGAMGPKAIARASHWADGPGRVLARARRRRVRRHLPPLRDRMGERGPHREAGADHQLLDRDRSQGS